MNRVQRRRRRLGQSLVELALILPILVAVVAGGAQVAYIAYSKVAVDTAAREGARVAVTNPDAINPVPSCPSSPPANGQTTGNAVCDAVYRSAGLLSGSNLHITVVSPDTSVAYRAPADVIRMVNNVASSSSTSTTACTGVAVTGSVTPSQVAHITDTGTNSIDKTTLSDGTFTLCMTSQNGSHTYTDTIYFTATGCATTQVTQTITVTKNGATPASLGNISLSPATCSTSSSSSTTVSSSSSSSTSVTTSSSSASTITSSTSSTTCNDVNEGKYVTVTVSYDAPIFVPFVGSIFSSSGSATVTATVTMRIESCNVSGGENDTGVGVGG